MGFKERLREARTAKGLNQTELSLRIGLSKNAVSNYENGVSNPNVDVLYRLFQELDVDANYLFQDDIPIQKMSLTTEERDIMVNYRDLNERGQNMLKEYIRLLSEDKKYSKQAIFLHNTQENREMVAYGLDEMKKEEWHPKKPENTAFD